MKKEEKRKGKKKENILEKLVSKELKKYAVPIAIICVLLVFLIIFNIEGKFTTISAASLKEMLEISELTSVEYTYDSIVSVSDDKNKEMYHVAYQGIVRAGFDFNDIEVNTNKKEKIIYVDIPEIKINSVSVKEKLDYIFVREKYDTETIFAEAYNKCVEDLEFKANNNVNIKKFAEDSAISTMKALIKPLEEKLPKGYKIEYK